MVYIQPTCIFFLLFHTAPKVKCTIIKTYFHAYAQSNTKVLPKQKQMYKSYCLSNTEVLSKQNKCIKVTVWSTVLDIHHWYIFEKVWLWFDWARTFSSQKFQSAAKNAMFWPTSVLKLRESFTVLGSQHRKHCVPTVLNEPMAGQSNADYYTDLLFMGGKNSWHYQHFIVVHKAEVYNCVFGKHSNTYLHVDPHQC